MCVYAREGISVFFVLRYKRVAFYVLRYALAVRTENVLCFMICVLGCHLAHSVNHYDFGPGKLTQNPNPNTQNLYNPNPCFSSLQRGSARNRQNLQALRGGESAVKNLEAMKIRPIFAP